MVPAHRIKEAVDRNAIANYYRVYEVTFNCDNQNGCRLMIISERIFKLMEEREMSQVEFAKRTGISQSTISDWKRKKTNPAADKIMTICDVLDVSPYEILQDHKKKKAKPDYRVCTAGTENYELLLEIEALDSKQKERLKGYLTAIRDM